MFSLNLEKNKHCKTFRNFRRLNITRPVMHTLVVFGGNLLMSFCLNVLEYTFGAR